MSFWAGLEVVALLTKNDNENCGSWAGAAIEPHWTHLSVCAEALPESIGTPPTHPF